MPRRCGVCGSKKREAVDRDLVAREKSFRYVSDRHGFSLASIYRHYCEHLPGTLAKAQGAKEVVRADNLLGELDRALERVRLLSDACDQWLRDPEDPSRYDVGPRSEDVTVVYTDVVNGRRVQKRKKLSALLREIRDVAPTVDLVEVKHADPRVLLLKAADTLRAQLELLAKLVGKLKEGGTVNVYLTAEFQAVQSAILDVLSPHPQIRVKVADALDRLGAARSN